MRTTFLTKSFGASNPYRLSSKKGNMRSPSPSRIPIHTNKGLRYLETVDATIVSFLEGARYPAGRPQPVPRIVVTLATPTPSESGEKEMDMDIVEPQPDPNTTFPDPDEWEDVGEWEWEEEWDVIDDRPGSLTPESDENDLVMIKEPKPDPDPTISDGPEEEVEKLAGPEPDPDPTFPEPNDLSQGSIDDDDIVMVQQPLFMGTRGPSPVLSRAPKHEYTFKCVIRRLRHPLGERKEPKADKPPSPTSTWGTGEFRRRSPSPPQGCLSSRPIPTLKREDAIYGTWPELLKTHREERPWLPRRRSDCSTESEYICRLGAHYGGRRGMMGCKVHADRRNCYVRSEPKLVPMKKERVGLKKRLQRAMRRLTRRMRKRSADRIGVKEAAHEMMW
ncbi:hypothetical protein B0J14DRAFT_560029 [Halenospora varia]|nr:hypothetical protein B0J14DRAFT_560029 [Halenospora varia]